MERALIKSLIKYVKEEGKEKGKDLLVKMIQLFTLWFKRINSKVSTKN